MNNDQAKCLLSLYRHDGRDAADPMFHDALEQARRDPELANWLEQQRAFDRQAHNALASVTPPAHLRQAVMATVHAELAGGRPEAAVDSTGSARHAPTGHHRSHGKSRVRWLPAFGSGTALLAAAAAAVAILAMVILPQPQPQPAVHTSPPGAVDLAAQLVEFKERGDLTLGRLAPSLSELRQWLREQQAPHDFAIPAGLTAHDGLGCQALEINGTPVALICFDLGEDLVVHLFAVRLDNLESAPANRPEWQRHGRYPTAVWSSGGHAFVLLGSHRKTGEPLAEHVLRELI